MSAAHAPDILKALATILCVAAVTTVVFQRIRQPVVLGYLIAGLIVGPHVAVPLFADVAIAHLFADLGVILLMFSLGLEFSLRKLVRIGPTAGIVALIQCSSMLGLGYLAARWMGWTRQEQLFTGSLIAISSTTIIVKAFAERGITGPRAELVYGILIVEDLIAILLLAVLTTVASGAGLSAGSLASTVANLLKFLVGVLVVGMLLVPRLVRTVVRLGRKETIVVTCVGICFASALLARAFGYSVALGAFVGGVLVAESGQARPIEPLIEPVRDIFAAVFFVSVGMLIDPRLLVTHWFAVVVLTIVVIAGKIGGVTLGTFLTGHGIRASVQTGLSLAQIGEFSFIIVGVGISLGAVREFLYPVAVAVSAVTTLFTPWLIRGSDRAADSVDRRLPPALQTYAALYGSWVEGLRSASMNPVPTSRWRRRLYLLVADVMLLAIVLAAVSLNQEAIARWVRQLAPAWPRAADWIVLVVATAVAAPFVIGAIRVARALGVELAILALPQAAAGKLDLGAAPRRALLVSLQIGILLVAGLPLVALTQLLFPAFPGLAILAIAIFGLTIALWRRATDLHGHVQAGAQVILEMLANQSGEPGPHVPADASDASTQFPGIGHASTVQLAETDLACGLSLRELNLRGGTGASVIAIERGIDAHGQPGRVEPSADEHLRSGDILVLTGTAEAVDLARRWLAGPPRQTAAPG
jgi:CPA2 family monovalent cation:H+ antiporter-2